MKNAALALIAIAAMPLNMPGQMALDQRYRPSAIVSDSRGAVYVSISEQNRVYRIDSELKTTTVAGTGRAAYNGDGGAAVEADLSGPHGLALDTAGNLLIADTWNGRVRSVNLATGVITTLADRSSGLGMPESVAADSKGLIYVADGAVRRIIRFDSRSRVFDTLDSASDTGYLYAVVVDGNDRVYAADAASRDMLVLESNSLRRLKTMAGNKSGASSIDSGDACSIGAVCLDSFGSLILRGAEGEIRSAVHRPHWTRDLAPINDTQISWPIQALQAPGTNGVSQIVPVAPIITTCSDPDLAGSYGDACQHAPPPVKKIFIRSPGLNGGGGVRGAAVAVFARNVVVDTIEPRVLTGFGVITIINTPPLLVPDFAIGLGLEVPIFYSAPATVIFMQVKISGSYTDCVGNECQTSVPFSRTVAFFN